MNTPHNMPTNSPKILVDPPRTGPRRCLKFCTRLPLESRAICPFYSFSRFPLFEDAQLHTPHQGESFLFFLFLFFPISQSRITTRPDIDLFYRICCTFVFLPGIRNERRRGVGVVCRCYFAFFIHDRVILPANS